MSKTRGHPMATAATLPTTEIGPTERLAETASQAIANHTTAGQTLIRLSAELDRALGKRAQHKITAILRLSAQDHPATPGKKYSVSQADDFARLDPDYARYKQLVSDLSLAKMQAEIEVTTARMLAELAIAAFRVDGGIR